MRRTDSPPPLALPTHERPNESRLTPSASGGGPSGSKEVAVDVGLVLVLLDLLWWIRR